MRNDGNELGVNRGIDKDGTVWVNAVGTLYIGRTTMGLVLICSSLFTPWGDKFSGTSEQLQPEYFGKLIRFAFDKDLNITTKAMEAAAVALRLEASNIWETNKTGPNTGPDATGEDWAEGTLEDQRRFHEYHGIADILDPARTT